MDYLNRQCSPFTSTTSTIKELSGTHVLPNTTLALPTPWVLDLGVCPLLLLNLSNYDVPRLRGQVGKAWISWMSLKQWNCSVPLVLLVDVSPPCENFAKAYPRGGLALRDSGRRYKMASMGSREKIERVNNLEDIVLRTHIFKPEVIRRSASIIQDGGFTPI